MQQISDEPVFLGGGNLAGGNGARASQAGGMAASRSMGSKAGIRKVINVVDDKMLIFDPPIKHSPVPFRNAGRGGAGGQINNTARIREHRFVFDRLFDDTAAQEDVYCNTTRPLLDSVLDGYNATVFAYGATGCGKTHTISGTPQAPGIIFLTMKELFERISEIRDTQLVDVSLSYLEIYNESIRDLLEPSNKQLVLREDADQRISVSNLSTHKPQNVEAVMDMILHGNQNRTISPTEANATSSRSHAVLQINVIQKNRTASLSEAHTFATLSIIDLAGSERASATKNRGDRLLEGANINKSLLALGNCINALCDPRRRNHIPYRDSKLTRLLKFSLGGNCKTVMIVCVSPSSKHYDETLNTLKYADRAKKIKTKIIRNEHNLDRHVGSYLKMITEQKAEIEELRNRESKAVSLALANADKSQQRCLKALSEAVESLRKTFTKASQAQDQKSKTLQQLRNVINQISQVECILASYHESTTNMPPNSVLASSLPQTISSALQKLGQEKSTLERHCSTVTQDKQMLDSAVSTLTRRLEDTPGWSEAFRASFRAQADALRLQSEVTVLDQVVAQPVSMSIVKTFSALFFGMMARLSVLANNDITTMDSDELVNELTTTIEEVVKECRMQLDQIVILSKQLPDDAVPLISGVKRRFTAPRLSTATPAAAPASTPGHNQTMTSTPAMKSATAARRVSLLGPSSITGNNNYPGNNRRLSLRQGRSMVLQSATRKQHMVPKSPIRNQRKAVKRVRWEDDSISGSSSSGGDLSMEFLDTPTTPPVALSLQSPAKVLNSLNKIPISPPEFQPSSTGNGMAVIQEHVSTTPIRIPGGDRVILEHPIASTPQQPSVIGRGSPAFKPSSTSSSAPSMAGTTMRFGVKGELRRKSGVPRTSIVPGTLPPPLPVVGAPGMLNGVGVGHHVRSSPVISIPQYHAPASLGVSARLKVATHLAAPGGAGETGAFGQDGSGSSEGSLNQSSTLASQQQQQNMGDSLDTNELQSTPLYPTPSVSLVSGDVGNKDLNDEEQ